MKSEVFDLGAKIYEILFIKLPFMENSQPD